MARARWKRQTRGKSPDQFTAFFVGPGRAEFALEGNGCGSSEFFDVFLSFFFSQTTDQKRGSYFFEYYARV